MQPFQCDLPPQRQETHSVKKRKEFYVHRNNHSCKTHIGGTDWTRNDPNRTRRTHEVPFIVACSHFTRKNARFRAPASSPQQPMQHSCSHSNAICHHGVKKRIELRTQEQPIVAKPIGGTDWTRNDPNRTRRTHEVPCIVACSHFTRKNRRFRAPASSPQHSPCNIHAAIPMRSATTASRNA